MFYRHSYDKLIYPLILFGLFIALSYRPKYHLRGDMPPEFFSATAFAKSDTKPLLDQKIAWAYWERAQMDIQWKYPRGQTLPPEPPAEFRVDGKALGPMASDPLTRQRYWRRLQQVWYAPETWQKQYQWDMNWASDPLTTAGEWVRQESRRFTSF